MKKITIFEASDGTRFNTEEGCLIYEAILAQVTAALEGIWHPGADNDMFNTGRLSVEHPPGTRERLLASLLPNSVFRIPSPLSFPPACCPAPLPLLHYLTTRFI